MKSAYAISSIARQLGKVSDKIDSLACGAQDVEQASPGLSDVYQGLLLDEIEHVQILALELTKLVSEIIGEEANADEDSGGVFAAGDLDTKNTGEDGDDEQEEENK